MKSGSKLLFFDKLIVLLFILTLSVSAQPGQPEDKTIDNNTQLEIIDSVSADLNKIYVFPEIAKKMESYARKQYKDKAYTDITSLRAFTEKLSEDMFSVCNDRHFGIRYLPDQDIPENPDREPTPEEIEQRQREMAYMNFAFEKLEILPGNIGYIKLNGFTDAAYGSPTAIAAMNFLANCESIIFDLRENGGGSPSMIQLISSYFFDEPTHLNSFYIRESDSIQQFWTQASVVGPRMSDVDLYVLTSNYTFSGAEEFSYNMKNLERATLIGETTGGGAHPVAAYIYPNLNVQVRIPFGRAINPISGTNWEGVGVEPDIKVPADQALDVAHMEALKKELETDIPEFIKHRIQWVIDGYDIKLNPIDIDTETLKKYAGTYGPRTITFEDGSLYYQRIDRPKFKMIPMTETMFWFEDLDYFRLSVELDDNGNPVALIGNYDNGRTDRSPKDGTI